MRTRTWMHIIAAPVAAAGVACGGGDPPIAKTPPVAVRAAQVIDTTIARTISAAGTVAPKDEITLSFKVGGVISRVNVDPGDQVRAGQTLALLNLRESDAALSKARSTAEKTTRDLDRARRLQADSVVTLAQLQDAETAADIARADFETASFNRQYAVIVAPSNGVILRRAAEPGETIAPGTVVLVVGSRARGNVMRVSLADRDAVLVRKGDRAVARFEAMPNRTFDGRVTQIAASADPGTGTYAIEITLRDGSALSAGLVGNAEIKPSRGALAVLVPIEAILEADGTGATVFGLSADGARAERRQVNVAQIYGDRIAIAGGLDGIRWVLTDGAGNVDDGAAVRVTR